MFGNARAGTPLTQARQRVGIDLPLKALAWEDADGSVWLSYNEPTWIAARHRLGDEVRQSLLRMQEVMENIHVGTDRMLDETQAAHLEEPRERRVESPRHNRIPSPPTTILSTAASCVPVRVSNTARG